MPGIVAEFTCRNLSRLDEATRFTAVAEIRAHLNRYGEQQPGASFLGLEREAVSLGSFHRVRPVLPCDETGYRSHLIKAFFMSHGCTSSPAFD